MKPKILFLLALSLMILGCNHDVINNPETCLPDGWQPVP